jgi:hypothetical protein
LYAVFDERGSVARVLPLIIMGGEHESLVSFELLSVVDVTGD